MSAPACLCFGCQHTSDDGNELCPRCGAELALGGRYRARARLGAGGSSRVYAVDDLVLGERRALKLLNVQQLDDWKALEQFQRQFGILRGLEHRAIPRVYEQIETSLRGVPCVALVQECIDGSSLATALAEGLRFDEAAARALLTELLELLAYLHRFSPPVLHRDIKPSNIMLRRAPSGGPRQLHEASSEVGGPSTSTSRGSAVLVDFDTARGTGIDRAVADGTMVGTAGFVPLEQLAGRAVPASDLFALGMTMIAVLSGREIIDLPVERMRVRFEDSVNVSPALVWVLRKLVEPVVEDRFQRAEEVLAALATDPAAQSAARAELLGLLKRRAAGLAEAKRFGAQQASLEALARSAQRVQAERNWGSGGNSPRLQQAALELRSKPPKRKETKAKQAERERQHALVQAAKANPVYERAPEAVVASLQPAPPARSRKGWLVGLAVVAGVAGLFAYGNLVPQSDDDEYGVSLTPGPSPTPTPPAPPPPSPAPEPVVQAEEPSSPRVATINITGSSSISLGKITLGSTGLDAGTEALVELVAGARGRVTEGRVTAPVVIAVFTDFGCSQCRSLDESLHELLAAQPEQVAVALYYWPLTDQPDSRAAAQAAWAAAQQGAGAAYAQALFASSDGVGDARLRAEAERLGLDLGRWEQDRTSAAAAAAIDADRELAFRLGVWSVPTSFVNATRLQGSRTREQLEEAVRAELR